MTNSGQTVLVFDVIADGYGLSHWLLLVALALGAAFGVWILRRAWQSRQFAAVAFGAIWLFGWVGIGGVGAGNVIWQRARCIELLRTGNYVVAEGSSVKFAPIPPWSKGIQERLVVDGTTFEYTSADLSRGGFNGTLEGYAPFREDDRLGVFHNNGDILRIELVRKANLR